MYISPGAELAEKQYNHIIKNGHESIYHGLKTMKLGNAHAVIGSKTSEVYFEPL